jgi:hypothetical protein
MVVVQNTKVIQIEMAAYWGPAVAVVVAVPLKEQVAPVLAFFWY